MTKQEYIKQKIHSLHEAVWDNELAGDYQKTLDTSDAKVQVEAAEHNIGRLKQQINFLESLIDPVI